MPVVFVCTPDDPWTFEKAHAGLSGHRVWPSVHPYAEREAQAPGNEPAYRCPACKATFTDLMWNGRGLWPEPAHPAERSEGE